MRFLFLLPLSFIRCFLRIDPGFVSRHETMCSPPRNKVFLTEEQSVSRWRNLPTYISLDNTKVLHFK